MAWLSLFLAPQGINQFALLLNKQDTLTEFDTLVPGRFQAMRDGTRVTYTEELSKDRGELAGIFISQKDLNSSNQNAASPSWWRRRAPRTSRRMAAVT